MGTAATDGGEAVRVRVPASSANLGPGFDSFALALAQYDEVGVALADDGILVEVAGEGADAVPRDESHLVVASMLTALRRWHRDPPGVRVRCRNTIPHGRGLGSSAAAIVAGLLAARGLLPHGHDAPGDDDVLDLAADLEGHPDNVAAALCGGLTIAWTAESGARAVTLAPHDDVLPVACVPDLPMSTETARGLLPAHVPHTDAVFNGARAGLLVAALTRGPELLFDATEDRLHQHYRAGAMPTTAELLERLRERGVPAVLSGAGPTVLALCDRRRHGVADVQAVAALSEGSWWVRALDVDLAGAFAERSGPGLARGSE